MRERNARNERRNVSLTLGQSVVDAETAQNFIYVARMEKSVSPHHHLESFWAKKKKNIKSFK